MKEKASYRSLYEQYGSLFLVLTCILVPLKLSLTYFAMVPLLVMYLTRERDSSFEYQCKAPEQFYVFSIIVLFVSLFGVSPWHSLTQAPLLLFYPLLMCASRDLVFKNSLTPYIRGLILGSSISAFGTFLHAAYPEIFPRAFLGAVSESGQLGMTISLLSGLLIGGFCVANEIKSVDHAPRERAILLGSSLLIFVGLVVLGFSSYLLSGIIISAVSIILILGVLFAWHHYASRRCLFLFCLPVLCSALLLNLKRGPVFGVMTAIVLLSIFYKKYIPLLISVLLITAAFLIPSVRDRFDASNQDFFGSGGRSEMWSIGSMLVRKNPLGVGYDNSNIIRNYSETIPRELSHFHNNFLNVTVETGWIGLAAFLTFFLVVLKYGASHRELYPFAAAVLAMLVAGLVEYNFGDTKVLLLLFLMVGFLAGSAERITSK